MERKMTTSRPEIPKIDWPKEEISEEGPPFYILRNGKIDGPFKNNQEARMALNLKIIRAKWVRYKEHDLDEWLKKNRKVN
jgi:hypothetical protein